MTSFPSSRTSRGVGGYRVSDSSRWVRTTRTSAASHRSTTSTATLVGQIRAELTARGEDAAGPVGQPELGPLPGRRAARGPGAGCHPHLRGADLGVLLVLRVPAVPREPLRRAGRGAGRGSELVTAGPEAAHLLQPPRFRRGDGRRDPQQPRGPARGQPAGVHDALHPHGRCRQVRLRRPAPRRRGHDRRGPGTMATSGTSSTSPVPGRRTSRGWSRTSATISRPWPTRASPGRSWCRSASSATTWRSSGTSTRSPPTGRGRRASRSPGQPRPARIRGSSRWSPTSWRSPGRPRTGCRACRAPPRVAWVPGWCRAQRGAARTHADRVRRCAGPTRDRRPAGFAVADLGTRARAARRGMACGPGGRATC